ncbi:MFS transporter [Streptomyces sp. CG1]|uniref:MFS transporter n=1 Tax=Streptomyces sp. CG1 TaxID=1287523 RepID=UPI0034E21411
MADAPTRVTGYAASAARRSATSRRKALWTLLITGLGMFMTGLDNLVVTTALPTIHAELHADLTTLEWAVSGYTLPFAVLLLPAAAIGDQVGRRRTFVAGIGVFTLASAAAALSQGGSELIVARVLQGVAAAFAGPVSLTLVVDSISERRRATVLGMWAALNGLSIAVGPLVGGLVTADFSWKWIFWLNVPIGALVVPLGMRKLQESRRPGHRVDVPGAVLASLGLSCLVYALIRGAADRWSSGVLSVAVCGVLLLAGFVIWEHRADAPMIPHALFRNRAFTLLNLVGMLMFTGMFGALFLMTQFIQDVQGYSPLAAGLRMLPWTAMPLLVSPIAGVLATRLGGRPVMLAGMLCQAAALAWASLIVSPHVRYGDEIGILLLGGIGTSLFFPPVADLVMGSVPVALRGVASGVNSALRELGATLGVAVLSAVFSVYGGYGTAKTFSDGLAPAVAVGAGLVGLGAGVLVVVRPAEASPTSPPLGQEAKAAHSTRHGVTD